MLKKYIDFNRNKKGSKMEDPTHSFRETNLALQLIWDSRIENKALMSWSSRKKKEGIFCTAYFIQKKFFSHLCFTSVYSVLNKLSEYTYFYISKNIALCTFYLFLKPSKAFSVIFKTFWSYSESIIFYACECRGNALKNDTLADKI